VAQFLTQMKIGSMLTKRKHVGEKYSSHFYLNEREHFVSYHQSEKTFDQLRRCKLTKNFIEKFK
jgi:hypothetical protein